MKRFLKKGMLYGIAAIMLTGSITGCRDSTQTSTTAVKTVNVWTNSSHTKDLANEMIGQYNSTRGKEKGIRIAYNVQGGDYQKTLDIAVQSGQVPELYYPIASTEDYVRQNALTAIEDMPGGAEFLEKYDGKLAQFTNIYEGKTYNVPFNLTTIGLIYNKELFVKNGIVDENGDAKPPNTWAEVVEYAKRCTNPDAKTYGIALPLKWGGYLSWDLIQPFFSSLGTTGYDYDNNQFDYNALAPAFEWLMEIKNSKSYYPGAEGLDNDPARAQFAEGRIAMKLAASWDVGVLNEQFPAKIEWGVAPVPTVTGTPAYKQWCSTDKFLAIGAGIKDEDKEKVMDVFKWFHEDEFLIKMYENGKLVPYDDSITAKAKNMKASKGWEEFCELVKVSVPNPVKPKIVLEGDSFSKIMMKIWMGETEIDEGLTDLTKRSNDALKKEADKGVIDFSLYSWGDFDIKAN